MLQGHLARSSAEAAHLIIRDMLRKRNDRQGPSEYWEDECLKKDPAPDAKEQRTYVKIQRSFLDSRFRDSGRPHFSMVLYGPPGAGKTEIAKGLASALLWKFIEITPSDFVASGEAEVELRAISLPR